MYMSDKHCSPYRSSGQPFLRQVACTSAVRYDSGMCRPLSHITFGSPSLIHRVYCSCRRRKCCIQLPAQCNGQ